MIKTYCPGSPSSSPIIVYNLKKWKMISTELITRQHNTEHNPKRCNPTQHATQFSTRRNSVSNAVQHATQFSTERNSARTQISTQRSSARDAIQHGRNSARDATQHATQLRTRRNSARDATQHATQFSTTRRKLHVPTLSSLSSECKNWATSVTVVPRRPSACRNFRPFEGLLLNLKIQFDIRWEKINACVIKSRVG